MKNADVEVKDMPAFPPAKMTALGVMGLAVKLGLAKQKADLKRAYCKKCHSVLELKNEKRISK